MNWDAVAGAVVVAAATASLTPLALRAASSGRRPDAEPDGDIDVDAPPDYSTLLSPAFLVIVGLVSLAGGLVVATRTPPHAWPAWIGLTGPLALAVCVDARTTWVPRLLSGAGSALSAVGLVVTALGQRTLAPLAFAAAGAAACGLFFALFRIASGRQLGLFDVRLAAIVGAVSAAHSPTLAAHALFVGTLLGAAWGVTHRLVRGAGPFAYGPPLWAGPFVALLLPLAA